MPRVLGVQRFEVPRIAREDNPFNRFCVEPERQIGFAGQGRNDVGRCFNIVTRFAKQTP